mgnify:CR=1 FL=1
MSFLAANEALPPTCSVLPTLRTEVESVVQEVAATAAEGQAVADLAGIGRIDEWEGCDVAQIQGAHLQDDGREIGAQDLRIGEGGARLEVLHGIQADAHTVGEPATAPGALRGTGLADRFDGQPLHLGALAVARDPGRARVDDVADARHRQRGLGDVGRQHDAPQAAGRLEDAVLLGSREAREQRQYFRRVR